MKPVPAAVHPLTSRFFLVALLAGLLAGGVRADDKRPELSKPRVSTRGITIAALEKAAPENLDDLRAIQKQVKAVLKKVVPCTVGLQVGGASGSGVIIDKEGHILTAGHVSSTPDRTVTVILPDGKRLKGKSLGRNTSIDSGLIQITDKGTWPHVEMGHSAALKRGQWVIAVGHPGGFRLGRTPVVRLGRIQTANDSVIRTDCTLVGGDSGGPLFDMEGRVIGIHSRIGNSIDANIHVPVDTYRATWDRLVKGEDWGGRLGFPDLSRLPYMGIEGDEDDAKARITRVVPGSPAEKAGLKVDDVILMFDGKKIGGYSELAPRIRRKKIGDKVPLEVLRGKDTIKLELVLGKRKN